MNLDELTQCFGMLGLEPGATIAQAKEAYRNSLQAFHPDKFPEGSSSQKWAANRLIVVKDGQILSDIRQEPKQAIVPPAAPT